MRRQLPTAHNGQPQTLRTELAASLARFLRLTLGAAGSVVALWLLSSLLAPGSAGAAVATPLVASTHNVQRTAAGAPLSKKGTAKKTPDPKANAKAKPKAKAIPKAKKTPGNHKAKGNGNHNVGGQCDGHHKAKGDGHHKAKGHGQRKSHQDAG